MCYYTLTLDHAASGEGHTRAIMIVDAKNKTDATAKFLNTFGAKYYNDVVITEGIHVENGFDRLLTEHARKYILKAKSGSENAPLVSYQNMIRLNHD